MKKDIRDYYMVQPLGTQWQVGYYAASPIHAVRQLMRDDTYNIGVGKYEVEVIFPNKEKKVYAVEKKVVTKEIIIVTP